MVRHRTTRWSENSQRAATRRSVRRAHRPGPALARVGERLTQPGSNLLVDLVPGHPVRVSPRSPRSGSGGTRVRHSAGYGGFPADYPGMAFFVGLLVVAGIAGCAIAWRRWRAERRELERVRATFARYVAPSVVDVLLARKDERLFTGRAVRATAWSVASRLRAFHRTAHPRADVAYLNEFYGLAGRRSKRHRGIIDTLLATDRRAVRRAARQSDSGRRRAASGARRRAPRRRDARPLAKQHRKPVHGRHRINTGEVIAGDAGFRDRREFTVVAAKRRSPTGLQEARSISTRSSSAFALDVRIAGPVSTSSSRWPRSR